MQTLYLCHCSHPQIHTPKKKHLNCSSDKTLKKSALTTINNKKFYMQKPSKSDMARINKIIAPKKLQPKTRNKLYKLFLPQLLRAPPKIKNPQAFWGCTTPPAQCPPSSDSAAHSWLFCKVQQQENKRYFFKYLLKKF